MFVVFFVSRNKDNKDISNFKERKMSFVVNDDYNEDKLIEKFNDFVNKGLVGELSRLYISVNRRDDAKVYKALLHYLIDHPEFDLSKIESKIASIAGKTENRAESKWLFDIDIQDYNKVIEFIGDLGKCLDIKLVSKPQKTINGWHIIVQHGFDTRELMGKWKHDIDLKRDEMELLVYGRKKTKGTVINGRN